MSEINKNEEDILYDTLDSLFYGNHGLPTYNVIDSAFGNMLDGDHCDILTIEDIRGNISDLKNLPHSDEVDKIINILEKYLDDLESDVKKTKEFYKNLRKDKDKEILKQSEEWLPNY